MSCLFLIPLLLCSGSHAAHAGSWQFTCTGSGSNTINRAPATGEPNNTTNWTPPGPQTGYFSLAKFGSDSSYSVSNATTITVNVTLTWVPASGQNATTDPAPPAVWVCESAQSEWTNGTSGSANDGLGEAKSSTGYYGSAASSDAPTSVPPAHWVNRPVSGLGQVTMPTRTLSAEGDAPVTLNSPYGSSCGSYIDFYTITIHPTPYNYHLVPGSVYPNPNGDLSFLYDWSSTSGNKNDLTTCFWHEYVTYQGTVGTAANPNKYYPPDPPFDFPTGVRWLNNPSVNPGSAQGGPAQQGGPMTGTYQVADTQHVPPLVDPSLYNYGIFTATQVYQYDDLATGQYTGQYNVQILGPDSGPFSIVREFKYYGPNDYRYTVTKGTGSSFVDESF